MHSALNAPNGTSGGCYPQQFGLIAGMGSGSRIPGTELWMEGLSQHQLQRAMAVQAPLCECHICTGLTLGIPLHGTAFPSRSQGCSPRCCPWMSAVLTGPASLSVTGSGHHSVTAKSKLTTQTSHNVMQLITKVFHLQRKKRCILYSQLPCRSEGCHAAVCAK